MEGCKHILSIRDCNVNDSGEFAFLVGKDKSTSVLDVRGKTNSDILYITSDLIVFFVNVSAVRVLRPLAAKHKAKAHDNVVLETQIDASNVRAYWMKDGRRIDVTSRMTDSTSKFEAKSKDATHTLKIKDVGAEDEGVYSLHAGRELTSSTLYVESK